MGGYKYTAGGGAPAAVNADFERVDVTDGTWTNTDRLVQATGAATNTGGINSVPLGTNVALKHIDGCMWHKALKTADGSDFDFTDRPAFMNFYLTLPKTGWRDDGAQEGGEGNPPYGSSCWVAMGVMTDPENVPTSPTGPYPRDLLGAGLSWLGTNNRMYRTFVRNTSNSGTHGSVSVNSQGLDVITSGDVTAGHRATNRLSYSFKIAKAGPYTAGALTPADAPESQYMAWRPRFDDGHAYLTGNYSAGQRWGRSHTDRLFIWVACGRNGSPGSGVTLKFDAYYNATLLDGGTNPSGTTVLSGP
jgi:hypothetical protein